MRFDLSFNGILAIAAGVISIAWGIWGVFYYLWDVMSYGFIFLGVGVVLFGLTDGFSDRTHKGQFMFKIGVIILIAAVAALGFGFLRQF
ncbi:MAG: hypothetical protein DWQ47_17140 [Acidobacteria bacterium]|nr:MAG: hypothetical protein DWQ32_04540 [Acidobacteriota bacterium]REK02234.1 MAG: hypothetical protein DWQ38_07610 [Acidobacteriota bacterium]REK13963.1 MAG: hypothetical protein DWQ43_10230 [Acidobacteriota bacterium]REK41958.1 MAG: hypothetical protein DWQ47_17140 [Acidobacteriota bacterium]